MSEQAPAAPAAPAAAPVGFMGGGGQAPAAAPAAAGAPTPPAPAAPPAAAPTNYFGEHVQENGVFKEGWTESLRAAGLERLATKAAFAKDESTLLKMMDETIGFVGKKAPTGPIYPVAGATDADISAFRKAVGVPDTADAYNLKPEKLPDGVEWNDADLKPYAEIFHKHHVPEAAARELIARHVEAVGAQAQAGMEALQGKINQFVQASEQTFQKEWGEAYDNRLESNRAFVSSRFDAAELSDPTLAAALSHPKIVRLVDEARRAMREAPLPGVGHEQGSGSMSPGQQGRAIMAANPNWRSDPELVKQVNNFYALEAAQRQRASR